MRELAAAATLWRSRWSELDLLDLRPRTNSRSRGIGPEATQRWEGGEMSIHANANSFRGEQLQRKFHFYVDLREDYTMARDGPSGVNFWLHSTMDEDYTVDDLSKKKNSSVVLSTRAGLPLRCRRRRPGRVGPDPARERRERGRGRLGARAVRRHTKNNLEVKEI